MTEPAVELVHAGEQGMPALVGSLQDIQSNYDEFRRFVSGQMVEGTDMMVIPGTKNPSILKPGMEKLLFYHGFGCEFIFDEAQSSRCTVPGQEEIVVVYTVRIYSKKTGEDIVLGASGECSTWEEKYRERSVWPNELTPEQRALADAGQLKQKNFTGKGGRKFTKYAIPKTGPEILAQGNTIRKMAMKRAMAAGTLHACRASAFFTQDVEDMPQQDFNNSGGNQPTSEPSGHAASEMATPGQLDFIKNLGEKQGLTGRDVNAWCISQLGKPFKVVLQGGGFADNLTKKEASQLVDALQKQMVPAVAQVETAGAPPAAPAQPELPQTPPAAPPTDPSPVVQGAEAPAPVAPATLPPAGTEHDPIPKNPDGTIAAPPAPAPAPAAPADPVDLVVDSFAGTEEQASDDFHGI